MMTFKKLKQIFIENNIPEDVILKSDSGWECDPTDMDGIYYNKEDNIVVFTQGYEYNNYASQKGIPDWKLERYKYNKYIPLHCSED